MRGIADEVAKSIAMDKFFATGREYAREKNEESAGEKERDGDGRHTHTLCVCERVCVWCVCPCCHLLVLAIGRERELERGRESNESNERERCVREANPTNLISDSDLTNLRCGDLMYAY